MFILIKKEISNFQGKITYQITKKNPPKINTMFHLIKHLKFVTKIQYGNAIFPNWFITWIQESPKYIFDNIGGTIDRALFSLRTKL